MDIGALNTLETEQWLLEGDCDKCRREKYCSKECTAFKRGFDGDFGQWVGDLIQKKHEERIKDKEKNDEEKQKTANTNEADSL